MTPSSRPTIRTDLTDNLATLWQDPIWDILIPAVLLTISAMVVVGLMLWCEALNAMERRSLCSAITSWTPDRLPTQVVHSKRALSIEEDGIACPTYVIECDDGRLLCLRGMYLRQLVRPHFRTFPSTQFRLIRYTDDARQFVVRPMGDVYLPEVIRVSMGRASGLGIDLVDGTFLSRWTYEWLRNVLLADDRGA
ncbi:MULTISPECIES: hypothetical protein [Dyella]|uniref:Uncharacterized protein n=2 Tax=Dyella TaxID=231454 RepID=A0A4R0YYH1_9GAMM|nr:MULTISPECIES: hypothetical protein [Dyella]TBR40592.1 hypothetical protein EYV96_10685 [Dyella terrae]TCI11826.1 hypothetical protein EZM97_00185 [Dyella soli]